MTDVKRRLPVGAELVREEAFIFASGLPATAWKLSSMGMLTRPRMR